MDDAPPVTLTADGVEAAFLPQVGMLGVSFRVDGREHLDLDGGVDRFRAGHTVGLPLLHPWANRLSGWGYRASGIDVDLQGLDLPTDQNGLPIHGTMLGPRRWEPLSPEKRSGSRAELVARFLYDDRNPELHRAFPFPHEITIEVAVDGEGLGVTTSITPTGDRAVPISFGYHPYLRLPGTRREELAVHLPDRSHVLLDDGGFPTGEVVEEDAAAVTLDEDVSFDDHYVLTDHRRISVGGRGMRVRLEYVSGFPHAQVFAPSGRNVVAIEPMTAPVDGLVAGTCPVVDPGDTFEARFEVSIAAE